MIQWENGELDGEKEYTGAIPYFVLFYFYFAVGIIIIIILDFYHSESKKVSWSIPPKV